MPCPALAGVTRYLLGPQRGTTKAFQYAPLGRECTRHSSNGFSSHLSRFCHYSTAVLSGQPKTSHLYD